MYLFNYLFHSTQVIYIIRMVIACLCGTVIGWERKNRAKDAGIRTHCIVSCASALIMIISKYGFFDMPYLEINDGTRIAAQIVSGVGFLGAGMIFVHKNTITGLTTAAGIWGTSGIGMAVGAGMYTVGIAATLILLIIQILMHKNSSLTFSPKMMLLTLQDDGEPSFQNRLYQQLEGMEIQIYSADVFNRGGHFEYRLTVELPASLQEELVVGLFENSKITRL